MDMSSAEMFLFYFDFNYFFKRVCCKDTVVPVMCCV